MRGSVIKPDVIGIEESGGKDLAGSAAGGVSDEGGIFANGDTEDKGDV